MALVRGGEHGARSRLRFGAAECPSGFKLVSKERRVGHKRPVLAERDAYQLSGGKPHERIARIAVGSVVGSTAARLGSGDVRLGDGARLGYGA